MNKKDREKAIMRLSDPELASRILKFGENSRREAKAFKSAKAEIKRVKKRDTYYEDVEQIDELSKKTLKSYDSKASKDSVKHFNSGNKKKVSNRLTGRSHAQMRLQGVSVKALHNLKKNVKEDVEPISEISKKTLGRYVSKASDDVEARARKWVVGATPEEKKKVYAKLDKKNDSRLGYIDKAVSKMKHAKEDVEPISEISKKVLGSYINKAAKSAVNHSGGSQYYRGMEADSKSPTQRHNYAVRARDASFKASKRLAGISKATKKLTKEDTMKTKSLVEDEPQVETPPNPFEVSRELYDQLIQGALAGNAVNVRNAVNDIMVTKAAEVVDTIKDEVAQTMFGTEDRPKNDDDEDEWEPEDDEDLDDEDDDTEHPEFDDEDESDEDDDVEGYDDEDDDLPDDESEDDDTEEA
jgi:hypothetical protein